MNVFHVVLCWIEYFIYVLTEVCGGVFRLPFFIMIAFLFLVCIRFSFDLSTTTESLVLGM